MSRERLILGASLILNVVLFGLLLSNRNAPKQQLPEQIAQASPPATTNSPDTIPTEIPTMMPSEEPTATAIEASPTFPPEPTATATVIIPPEPTSTPIPTATPLPVPSPTIVPGPDWLRYTNLFRSQANLPQLHENVEWSEGSRLHSIYMLNNNQTVHEENINNPSYTAEGNEAGTNGNIAASGWFDAPDRWPIDYWIAAPFHIVPLLDPRLEEIGFGLHRDAASSLQMASTMDVRRGVGELPASVSYPVFFPKDGGQSWVLKYSLPEFPNPLTSCPGFFKPVGTPIVLQLGSGDITPSVSSTSLRQGETVLVHCVIDETSYINPSEFWQRTGRLILDERDAIVILPSKPLVVGQTYTVSVEANGETYNWSFDTVAPPE